MEKCASCTKRVKHLKPKEGFMYNVAYTERWGLRCDRECKEEETHHREKKWCNTLKKKRQLERREHDAEKGDVILKCGVVPWWLLTSCLHSAWQQIHLLNSPSGLKGIKDTPAPLNAQLLLWKIPWKTSALNNMFWCHDKYIFRITMYKYFNGPYLS